MVGRLLGKITAVLFSLFIGFVIIETGVRLARPLLPPAFQLMLRDVKKHPFSDETILPPAAWRPVANYQMAVLPGLDDELQYPNAAVSFDLTTKNWLDANSQVGFRVDSLDWEPTWPVDIVAIGDSFTFCFTEYEDCWVRRLESDFGYSVVNLGQGATGGISHTNILQTFGLPYKPKVVLWQWYGNDNNEDYGFVYPRQTIVDEDSEPLFKIENDWLVSNLATFKLLAIFMNSGGNGRQGFQSQADTHMIEIMGESIFFGRPYSYRTADLSEENNQLGQALGFEALIDARDILRAEGIELVVFTVPYKEEVYRTQILGGTDFDPTKIDQMEVNRITFLEFCKANEMTCFDPTADLVEHAAGSQPLYFSHDTHLNSAGNEVLLEILNQELEGLGVLD